MAVMTHGRGGRAKGANVSQGRFVEQPREDSDNSLNLQNNDKEV